MPSYRPRKLADEAVEELLSGAETARDEASPLDAVVRSLREAGQAPPPKPLADRHLAALAVEIERPRDAPEVSLPRRYGSGTAAAGRRIAPPRLAAGATAFVAMLVLAVAGALPGPVQAAAADVLGVVGITLPDGRGAPEQRNAPAEPSRGPASAADSPKRPDHKPSPSTGRTSTRSRDDRERPRRTGSRPGATGDATRRDDPKGADPGRADGADRDLDQRGDADDDHRAGADRENDAEALDDEPADSTDLDDEADEAPGTGSLETDEPEDLEDNTEGRSQPSDDAITSEGPDVDE